MSKFRIPKLALLLSLMMVIVFIAGCGGSAEEESAEQQPVAEPTFINIATGGTSGTYYPLGGAIAEILNKNMNVRATAEASGASVANINLLAGGNVDMAFVQNDVSYYAVNGTELFETKIDGLQALATLYPETCQIMTLEKTGIKSVADFRGKKIAVGARGSGVEANARQILAAYGMSYDDINPQYLSFSEAANGLKDGNIDAGFITAGFPTAAIQDIAAQHNVVLISIDDAVADKLIADYPFYTKNVIPAGTYQNQEEDAKSLAVKAMLVVSDKMDEQTAYEITKSIYSNLDKLIATHAVGKLITIENAQDGISIPLHAGADKYYKELSK